MSDSNDRPDPRTHFANGKPRYNRYVGFTPAQGPKLLLHVTPGGLAICGRPGCNRRLGEIHTWADGGLSIRLPDSDSKAWVQDQNIDIDTSEILAGTFERKRRRRASRGSLGVKSSDARPGDVIVCADPRCRARQVVPPLSR